MNRRIIGSVVMAAAFAVLLLGASMLFLGGSTQASAPVKGSSIVAQSESKAQGTAVAVNKAAGTWQDIAPFPTVTVEFTPAPVSMRLKRAGAAAYHPNGKLYVLGGRVGTDGDDTTRRHIYEYTPGDPGTWAAKAGLLDDPAVGSRFTANMAVATLTDTTGVRIYAIGGNSIDSVPTNRVRAYNPIADTVTLMTGDEWPATPVRVPGAWAVHNNKLYIYGGFSALGSGGVFAETWVFDPMGAPGSKWTQLASANLPTARGYMAGVMLDGQIYAIGGNTWDATNRAFVPSNLVHRMDPSQPSPTWTAVANLPTARGDLGGWAYDSTTNFEISGRIAVAGGVFPVPDAVGYLYNPGTNSWGSFPSMVHATRNYGYAQLNGYLYAFGGYDYTNGLPQGANWNQRYDATTPIGTATSTVTGTPPTSTRTGTPTNTAIGTNTPAPTATTNPCTLQNYQVATATGTVVVGTVNTGSACDDCVTGITIPFPFRLYDQTFTQVGADSNGKAHFPTGASVFSNTCLPQATTNYTIYPYWDDLRTDGAGGGIFTSVLGTSPNRIFNIEWRTTYFSGGGTANFSLLLYEGLTGRFDVVYGVVTQGNTSATVGVQRNPTTFTQYACNGAGGAITSGLRLIFTLPTCVTGTPVSTNTVVPTVTSTVTIPAPTATVSCATGTVEVAIVDFGFNPQNVSIPAGNTIRWTNTGQAPHTSTSDTGVWDSGTLNNGQQFSHTFNTPGSYPYTCDIHSNMVGTITVIGGCPTSTVAPTNTTAPTSTVVLTATTVPSATPTSCVPQTAQVNMENLAFVPPTIVIAVGSTVNWTNLDQAQHDTVSTTGVWQSTLLAQGESYSFTFTAAGSYSYFCTPHPFMTGTIIVTGGCATPSPEPTATAMPTATACAIQFSDVPTTHTFYEFIRCLACRGIISGYADGTFRPENNITRGQISKMVSNAAGFTEPVSGQTFEDVPPSNTFYIWIQRLATRGIMSGYPCGGTGEPCGPGSRPYFRWNLDATRGQLSKIVSEAAGFNEPIPPTQQTFTDVPPSNTFWVWIERLADRGVIGGYPCGGAGEPCDSENRPYFRWGFNVTRGQASKIVANAFFPGCMTP